jgi:hypothetical protein
MKKYVFKNHTYYVDVSNKKDKKYDVFDYKGDYILSFGDLNYQHYADNVMGYYSHLNHYDEKRRKLFRERFKQLYEENKNNPRNRVFWSYSMLW